MAFKKKTWKDRLVEYAGRRKITNVSTLAAQIVDMERAEGVVSEEGSAFSAANMNDFEQRVADGFSGVQQEIDGINSDLGGYQFDTIDGIPSYKAGADSVWVPFSSGEHLLSAEIVNGAKDDPFVVTIDSSGWNGTVTVCCGVFWAYGVSGIQVILPSQAQIVSQHDVVAPGGAGYYYNIVFKIDVTTLNAFSIGGSTASGVAKFIVYNVFK